MKITNNSLEIEVLKCSYGNGYYNVKFGIRLFNDITDTDFATNVTTRFSNRDLQYITDNIHDFLDNKIDCFGFKSCDKSLSFHFAQNDEGITHQIEIWKEKYNINYEFNLPLDISYLESFDCMLDYIRSGDFDYDPKLNRDDALHIKVYNNRNSGILSLSFSLSEDKIIRRNCMCHEDVDLLKSQITKLLDGDTISININSDNMFLSICAFGPDFLVDGEIRDFTFPTNNKMQLLGGYSIDRENIERIIDAE